MTPETVQAMIDQALQRNSTNTHDDGSQNSGGGPGRPVQPARVCSYTDFMKCQPLNFKGTEGVVKGNDVGGYTQRFQELALMCTKFLSKTLDDAIEFANDLMDQKLRTYAERQAENKRKLDNNNQAQQQLLKKQNVWGEEIDCWHPINANNQRTVTCYECGNQGHYMSDCPVLKNQGTEARGMAYALGGGETDQDINNMEDDINA
ncbi:retrovirus-related pol polyprotein from transposon TNT 1-94 [Tanacetum coccineum]